MELVWGITCCLSTIALVFCLKKIVIEVNREELVRASGLGSGFFRWKKIAKWVILALFALSFSVGSCENLLFFRG